MIYYGIILYNKGIMESDTFISLSSSNVSVNQIILFDNSTELTIRNKNIDFSKKKQIKYFTNNKNIGLSAAYNYLIDSILPNCNKNDDFFVTLDDDTTVSSDFVESINRCTVESDRMVFVPKVFTENILLSPSNVNVFGKIKPVSTVEKICNNKMTAINTGVCYRMKVFDTVRFCENLFLDCVDHCMFSEIRKHHIEVQIMPDAILYQNYSRSQMVTEENRLQRYKITTKDVHEYGNRNRLYYIFFLLSELRQAILLNRKYNSNEFFKVYLEVWFRHCE